MKRIFTLAFSTIMCATYLTQGEDLTWSKTYGGSDYDEAKAIINTEDNGLLLGGYSYSDNDIFTTNNKWQDAWLIKSNANNLIDWTFRIGGNDADVFESTIELSDGYISVGWSASTDLPKCTNKGFEDALITKTSKTGELIWTKTIGGSGMDKFFKVVRDAEENLYAIGYSNSDDFDISSAKGQLDVLLSKFDREGHIIWTKNFGGSDDDFAYDMLLLESGDIVVAGTSNSDDKDLEMNFGEWDNWVFKMDSEGHILWSRTHGGSGQDEATNILLLGKQLVLCGNSFSDHNQAMGSSDAWVLFLDDYGNQIVDLSFGTSEKDIINNAIVHNNKAYLVGHTVNNNSTDGWIISFDEYGNVIQNIAIGGSSYDLVNDITFLDNQLFFAGTTNSNDGDISNNAGDFDFWVGSFGDIITPNTETLLTYPNPANDHLNIVVVDEKIESLKVYSTAGQLILIESGNQFTQQRLDLQNLTPGVYIIEVNTANKTSNKRFIKS